MVKTSWFSQKFHDLNNFDMGIIAIMDALCSHALDDYCLQEDEGSGHIWLSHFWDNELVGVEQHPNLDAFREAHKDFVNA